MISQLLKEVWQFYKKQPVLHGIVLNLLIIPLSIIDMLWLSAPGMQEGVVIEVLLGISTIFFGVWAEAAILLVAKRMIVRSGGRMRSSCKVVVVQARSFIVPLLLTQLLWICQTILWSLLLIVPGVIMGTRRFFYAIIIVSEHTFYRNALHASANVVRSQTGKALVYIVGTVAVCGIPIVLSSMILDAFSTYYPLLLTLPVIIIKNTIWAYALLAYELIIVNIYAKLKNGHAL